MTVFLLYNLFSSVVMFPFHHCVKVRFRNGCSYEWSAMFPGDECCCPRVFLDRETEVEQFNLDGVIFCCYHRHLNSSSFMNLLSWSVRVSSLYEKQLERSFVDEIIGRSPLLLMGVAADFFHVNEIKAQNFKPDCVIISSHHVDDGRSYSYIVYTYSFASIGLLMSLGFHPILGATWATGSLVCCCSSPLAAFIVKFKLDVAFKYRIMLTVHLIQ